MEHFHTVVVGGGQAGLGISYFLHQKGIGHTVLERGKIGETWRKQRWDSFALNTPSWANLLPGDELNGNDPGEFWLRDEFVEVMEAYARRFDLPVRSGVTVTGVAVTGIGADTNAGRFRVETSSGPLTADNVVIASGGQNKPMIPAVARQMPDSLVQLHAEAYRRPDLLPKGAALVVGSAQSGVQVAEDLLEAGRKVYLATSKVGRIFRTHRGKDFIDWGRDTGFFDQTLDDLEDPAMARNTQPQISGTHGGHTVSLQSLEKMGAILLGRLEGWRDGQLCFQDNLADHIRFADQVSGDFRNMMENFIESEGIDASPLEHDEADQPDSNPENRNPPTLLDPKEAGIASVIWCTGFNGDFGWIENVELDERGVPVHERGVSNQPGLYYCGFPWLHKRKSGLIFGIAEDAAHIVAHMVGHISSQV